MLYDAIKVFEKKQNAVAELFFSEEATALECRTKLLVDNYIPSDGTYILITMDADFRPETPLEVKYDKKSNELKGSTEPCFNYVRYLDYNSKLININKPIDTKKIIHSNQVYAFFVKKENISGKKLTVDVVDGYYNTLSAPETKYKGKGKKLYQQIAKELGEPDSEALEKIRAWMKDWLANPEQLPIDYTGKDYLKLFFE